MANEEHIEILKQGVHVWNEWRTQNPQIIPDLRRASLNRTNLRRAMLASANLKGVHLKRADLRKANLSNADLRESTLDEANLVAANLSGANLADSLLTHADFNRANLSGARFFYANIGYTVFGMNDLSEVHGLATVRHHGPSVIDIDTIYQSKGKIPGEFLRGAGVDENFITYIPSLVGQPIEFYSCFISYSSLDEKFAERLYSDLQRMGIRCWYAPEDLKIGEEIRIGIDESIRLHDKLLLVLSETSVKSQWVQQEVETALAKEREQGRIVLFPIRLDNAVMQLNIGWPALIKNTRNIGDFTGWENHESYQKAFNRLLRDLKAETLREGRT